MSPAYTGLPSETCVPLSICSTSMLMKIPSNPSGLQAAGDNLFTATANSGAAAVGNPGSAGRGLISQGFLESSNVNVGTEMISLIVTQRAFEASSKVVSASDEMMGMANALRR